MNVQLYELPKHYNGVGLVCVFKLEYRSNVQSCEKESFYRTPCNAVKH